MLTHRNLNIKIELKYYQQKVTIFQLFKDIFESAAVANVGLKVSFFQLLGIPDEIVKNWQVIDIVFALEV